MAFMLRVNIVAKAEIQQTGGWKERQVDLTGSHKRRLDKTRGEFEGER